MKSAWPSTIRTIFGDQDRFETTYFAPFKVCKPPNQPLKQAATQTSPRYNTCNNCTHFDNQEPFKTSYFAFPRDVLHRPTSQQAFCLRNSCAWPCKVCTMNSSQDCPLREHPVLQVPHLHCAQGSGVLQDHSFCM